MSQNSTIASKNASITLIRGKVIAARRWSDTHVSSSGGGGYVDAKMGGHVQAAQVHSDVVQHMEIFIRTSDAEEEQRHDFGFTDLSFREGNDVFLITVKPEGGKCQYAYVENIDTHTSWSDIDAPKPAPTSLKVGARAGVFWGFICYAATPFICTLWGAKLPRLSDWIASFGWMMPTYALLIWYWKFSVAFKKRIQQFPILNKALFDDIQASLQGLGIYFELTHADGTGAKFKRDMSQKLPL